MRTLSSAWRKLWPDSVPEHDLESFFLLEVDAVDIQELVEKCGQDLWLTNSLNYKRSSKKKMKRYLLGRRGKRSPSLPVK